MATFMVQRDKRQQQITVEVMTPAEATSLGLNGTRAKPFTEWSTKARPTAKMGYKISGGMR